MMGLRNEKVSDQRSHLTKLGEPIEYFEYEQGVEQSLDAINAGELSKIVLARQLTFDLSSDLSPFSIAHGLRARFPDCHSFSLSLPQQGTWVGASPETLARIRGLSLRTEALAGSAPRGPSAGKDAHWGKTILAREKEVREHRLVIESIIRRLSSAGITSIKEELPRLLRLANLQHVRTPLQGKLPEGLHPFDVLSNLHPTPAMGELPVPLPWLNWQILRKLPEDSTLGLPDGWTQKEEQNLLFLFVVEEYSKTHSLYLPVPGSLKGPSLRTKNVKQTGNCKPCLKSLLEVLIFRVE